MFPFLGLKTIPINQQDRQQVLTAQERETVTAKRLNGHHHVSSPRVRRIRSQCRERSNSYSRSIVHRLTRHQRADNPARPGAIRGALRANRPRTTTGSQNRGPAPRYEPGRTRHREPPPGLLMRAQRTTAPRAQGQPSHRPSGPPSTPGGSYGNSAITPSTMKTGSAAEGVDVGALTCPPLQTTTPARTSSGCRYPTGGRLLLGSHRASEPHDSSVMRPRFAGLVSLRMRGPTPPRRERGRRSPPRPQSWPARRSARPRRA